MREKRNMVIAQSGGPSMVINQSLVGAILEARKLTDVGEILGAMHGIKGILAEAFIDLRKERKATLEAVAKTPASALGTIRMKPTPKRFQNPVYGSWLRVCISPSTKPCQ